MLYLCYIPWVIYRASENHQTIFQFLEYGSGWLGLVMMSLVIVTVTRHMRKERLDEDYLLDYNYELKRAIGYNKKGVEIIGWEVIENIGTGSWVTISEGIKFNINKLSDNVFVVDVKQEKGSVINTHSHPDFRETFKVKDTNCLKDTVKNRFINGVTKYDVNEVHRMVAHKDCEYTVICEKHSENEGK